MLKTRSLLSCMFVWCSCVFLDLDRSAPFMGHIAFPFIGQGKVQVTAEGKEKNERDRRRLPGLSGPSPSCGSRRSCRCQQGQLHVVALFFTGAMRRRHLPVMVFHSIPADVVVN